MCPQIACPSRCKVALVAFVWLFSTMRFQMSFQITCLRQCKTTLIAFAWLFSGAFSMSPQTTCLRQCTTVQALKKFWIKDFAKNDYLDSNFLKPEFFQMKIFGCYLICSFTFILYLGMSWKQSSAAVVKESVAIQTGWGDQLTRALKKRIQIFLLWSRLWFFCWKYLYTSNVKFTMIKSLFSSFFQTGLKVYVCQVSSLSE